MFFQIFISFLWQMVTILAVNDFFNTDDNDGINDDTMRLSKWIVSKFFLSYFFPSGVAQCFGHTD
jgi:hypothetical protein